MIAYKGFNDDMTCTKGKGNFKYEIGKTYTENYSDKNNIQTRNKGFHAVIEPLAVLDWYDERFAKVELSGDINDNESGIVCSSEITILKELSMADLIKEEIIYYLKHKTGLLNKKSYYAIDGFKITTIENTPLLADEIGEKLIFISDNEVKVLTVDSDKIKPYKYYNKEGIEQ